VAFVGVFVSRCLLACDCYYYLQRWKGFAGVFFVIWGGGVGRLGGRRESFLWSVMGAHACFYIVNGMLLLCYCATVPFD